MACNSCKNLIDITDNNSPYFQKICSSCGRNIKFRKAPNIQRELTIEEGEQFIIPKGFLRVDINPLKGNGYLTKYGIGWFAELIFIEDLSRSKDELNSIFESNEQYCHTYLKNSDLLSGIDISHPSNSKKIFEILEKNKTSAEWWAFLFGVYSSIVSQAIDENDAQKAAWAMRFAERCRAMHVFKEHLEEVVWMGHSARRLVDAINIWQLNKNNSSEEFWQSIFNENPFVLSQLFSSPVVFIKEKAYVGGMKVDQQDAKFVDYLYANESSNDALLVEIKTPETKLLGKKYRKGVYSPSGDISGSVIQVLDYRRELSRNIRAITEGTNHKIDVFNPRCIVIAGNSVTELNTEVKRKSFELFRTNLKDVEIVTYDELFKKAETLATLFNLTQKKE